MKRMIASTIRPGRDHRGGQADLALRVEQATAGGDQDQDEGPEKLGEEPPPLLARIVEVLAVAELERQQVPRSGVSGMPARSEAVGSGGALVGSAIDQNGSSSSSEETA